MKSTDLLIFLFLFALPINPPAFGSDRDTVILGTATAGGGFPVYGAVLAEAINKMDPSLEVQTLNTKGSTENVPLLESGKLDIALVQGEVFFESIPSVNRSPLNSKIIAAMYSPAGAFVVRADSSYHIIIDLKGLPVVFGARDSGLVLLARYLLDGIGLDIDRDFKAIYVDRASEGPMLVEDGSIMGWRNQLARVLVSG
jgi:hypothetical protein